MVAMRSLSNKNQESSYNGYSLFVNVSSSIPGGLFFYTKRPFPSLYVIMNLYSIIFGENDSYFRGREAAVEPFDNQKSTTHIVPEKFREDVAALTKYVGEARFKSGLTIEVTNCYNNRYSLV